MKKRIITVVVIVVAAVVVVLALGRRGGAEASSKYQFAQVERGDLENVVSATGTLSPVGTVDVGTQVSGTIEQVLVDYNQSVKTGQVLAVIDTTFLAASVHDAKAAALKAQAQYEQADRDYKRTNDLYQQELVSEADLEDSQTNALSARASYLSSQAALDRARANLGYAVIKSPISGIVIARNVEKGQTVAASFSTPTLFVIAENLNDMEVYALVDESDIGQIQVGQRVRFTVEAYYDKEFTGKVKQIRLQPETVQNVVNYTVVVSATNEGGLLFPGMTATVDFLIEEKKDVLLVPNAALRFRPSTAMVAELRQSMSQRAAAAPGESGAAGESGATAARRPAAAGQTGSEAASGGMPSGGFGQGGQPSAGAAAEGGARLWYLDQNGHVAVSRVVTGATDGRVTEIVSGPGIHEGMNVITSVEETSEGGSNNPLTPSFGRRH
jgi:HlyD family secretion protein